VAEELEYGTALVTGGAGFIGSHICEELIRQGKRVVCLDNFVAGSEENVAHLMSDPSFELVRADVSKLDQIERHFSGIDVVFHNAASKNTVCRIDPHLDLDVNGWGAWCVAEASRSAGVKKVVHASTGSVYGEIVKCPQDETHPLAPRSFYGTSKLAGESYLRAFNAYYPDFRYSVIRYFHVYGPRQESGEWGGVVPIFIRRALNELPLIIYGDGTQIRSFTYVTDDVNANIVLANSEEADGEAYNAASALRITVLDLAHHVLRMLDKEHLPVQFEDWRPGDIRDFDVDNKKVASIGATFPTSFEEGLGRTIEWYRRYLRDTGLIHHEGGTL
jgi:nucleoside-diphosphate-sugar epimerase